MTVVQLPARVTLGGSSAAAACGVDPYRSQVELWAELTGRLSRPETEAMRWGKLMEPVIFAALEEDGYTIAQPPGSEWIDAGRPWLVGHPDGFIYAPPVMAGQESLLEVKTANHWAHEQNGTVPLHYEAQIQTYLHLTGLHHAVLACLVNGQRLVTAEVERNDRAIALLLDGMERFVGYVQRDEPPPPDASDSARRTLGQLYPEHRPGGKVRLLGDDWQAYRELVALRAQRDAVDEQIQARENRIKALMGDAEEAVSPHDVTAVRWRSSTSKRVDVTAFKTQRPELASLFMTETTTRRLTIV